MNVVRLNTGYFPYPEIGRALSGASIYVGEPDTDPEVAINQKQISVLQEDKTTIQVAQPILTGGGGVPLYNGSPVTILVSGDYSLKVMSSTGSQIYYIPSADTGTQDSVSSYGDDLTAAVAAIGATETNLVIDSASTYITANTIVPENITLVKERQGLISGAFNLTIDGGMAGDLSSQWFSSNITVDGFGLVPSARPEWWGAVADGVTDSAAAFQSAVTAHSIVDATTSGGTYILKSKITVPAGRTLLLYGSTVQGDALNADYIFETTASLASPKTRVYFKGGEILLGGSTGAINFSRGVHTANLIDMRISDADDLTASTIFLKMLNGFNLGVYNTTFAGASATGKFASIESDAGDGYTVTNNVKFSGCIFSATTAATLVEFINGGSGMNTVGLDNCSMQGGGSQIVFTTANSQIVAAYVNNTKFEVNGLTPTGIDAEVTGTGQIRIGVSDVSFANTEYPFDLTDPTGESTITINNVSYTNTSGTKNVFNENEFDVTYQNLPRFSGYTLEPVSGTGAINHAYLYTITRTANTAIKAAWSGWTIDNYGAVANIAHTLPDTPFKGCRLRLSQAADGFRVSFTPDGTNVIRYKNYEIPNLVSDRVGEHVTIEFDGVNTWNIVNYSGFDRYFFDVMQYAVYDFAVDGGAQGFIGLRNIPDNAIVTYAFYEVITPFASLGAATVAWGVQTDDPDGLLADTAYNDASYGAGLWAFNPNTGPTTFTVKTTANRDVGLTISTADLTAGKVIIWYNFIVSE